MVNLALASSISRVLEIGRLVTDIVHSESCRVLVYFVDLIVCGTGSWLYCSSAGGSVEVDIQGFAQGRAMNIDIDTQFDQFEIIALL